MCRKKKLLCRNKTVHLIHARGRKQSASGKDQTIAGVRSEDTKLFQVEKEAFQAVDILVSDCRSGHRPP